MVKPLLLIPFSACLLLAQTVPPPTPPSAVAPAPPTQATPEPAPARLLEVKTVYLLKMARGLHQYLAQRLSSDKTLVVTTDPNRADVLLTDRLGKDFEDEVLALFPPPRPAAKPKSDDDEEDAASSSGEFKGDKMPQSTWGRGRGTIFLVDRTNGDVLWSYYAPSASSRGEDMQSTAAKIGGKLKDDLEKLRNPSKKGFFGK
jgi:hypothetical protein